MPRLSQRATYAWLILIIALVAFAVYFNSLFNDFVYDDTVQVLENRWMRDFRYIPEVFTSNAWGFHGIGVSNYYRPIMHVVYMIDFHLFGLEPWGFHLVNIIFHAGISVLVFVLIETLLKASHPSSPTRYPAFMAAVLFAAHPIHTEAVTWVAGVPELTFTLFSLLSLHLYIKATAGEGKIASKGLYALSILFFSFSIVSKETALTLFGILLAFDIAYRNALKKPFSHIRLYLPYLMVSGLYFILRAHALGGFAPMKRHQELGGFEIFINAFVLFADYLKKLVLPVNQNAFYILHPVSSISDPRGIVSLAVALAFLAFLYLSYRRSRGAFLGLAIVAAPLLPVLYIPALGENTFADRYLYLPSVGFSLLAALAILQVRQAWPKAAVSVIIAPWVLAGIYSVGTVKRNVVWKNEFNLWSDTVKKSPDGAMPHHNMGISYYKRGMVDEAIGHYLTSLSLKVDPKAYNNLGLAYRRKGMFDAAIEQFRTALIYNPDFPEARNNLGLALLDKGLPEAATEEFQTALRMRPYYVDAHVNLGQVYLKTGELDRAIEQYEAALRLKPEMSEAYNSLGMAYLKKGLIEKALKSFQEAERVKPGSSETQQP